MIPMKHGSPTSNAPVFMRKSAGQSWISWNVVREGSTRILKESLRYDESESCNAAKGTRQNGLSGRSVISLPLIRSAIGVTMMSCSFFKALYWECLTSTRTTSLATSSSVGESSGGISIVTLSLAPISWRAVLFSSWMKNSNSSS